MPDQLALLSALTHYAHDMLGHYQITDVLHRLCDQVVEVLGADGAGVSLSRGDADPHLHFVAATDSEITTIESVQEQAGQGPCHDAYRHGGRVVVPDLELEERWPDYRRVALELGYRSVAGLPMPTHPGGPRLGALNLYQHSPRTWTDKDLEVAQLLAAMASGYIVNNYELDRRRTVVQQLQKALDSRVVIEQAKGVLAGRHGIGPNEAFALLRGHARSHSEPLYDVCQQLVRGELDIPPDS